MTPINQGTGLYPRQEFSFKVNGKGRAIHFKATDKFWVASSKTEQINNGIVEVCRDRQTKGAGYHFSREQIEELFRLESGGGGG